MVFGPHQIVETMSVRSFGRDALDRHHAAPCDLAGEDRMVGADDVLAHGRLDAVGADQQIAMRHGCRLQGRPSRRSCVFVDAHGLGAEHDRVRVEREHRLAQSVVQVGAMDLEVRRAVPLLVCSPSGRRCSISPVSKRRNSNDLGRTALGSSWRAAPGDRAPSRRWRSSGCPRRLRRAAGACSETRTLMPSLQQRGRSGEPSKARSDDDDLHGGVLFRACSHWHP